VKAVAIDGYGGPQRLRLRELSEPRPAAGEVLVRVRAAGINPVDWKICEGRLRFILRLRFPYVPGGDIAGEVVATGDAVTGFGPGEPVFGFTELKRGGGYAELAVARASALAAKPASLSFAEAAGLPIAACTALQALRDLGGLSKGGRLLVIGAAGGVGHFAVQLGKAFGARVGAVCAPANAAFVRALGADLAIDYTSEDFTARAERYDVILDAAAASSFTACRALLAPGGAYVTTLPSPGLFLWSAVQAVLVTFRPAKRAKLVVVRQRAEDLTLLARLADQGRLRPALTRTYPLERAGEAQEASRSGHTRGKLVLEI